MVNRELSIVTLPSVPSYRHRYDMGFGQYIMPSLISTYCRELIQINNDHIKVMPTSTLLLKPGRDWKQVSLIATKLTILTVLHS